MSKLLFRFKPFHVNLPSMKYIIAITLLLFVGCKDKDTEPSKADLDLMAVKNETLGMKMTWGVKACEPASHLNTADGIEFVHYDIGEIQVNKPSYEGSKGVPGKFQDPLTIAAEICPSKEYWLDIAVDRRAAVKTHTVDLHGKKINITVKDWEMPAVSSLPLYVQMAPWDIAKAHGDTNQTRMELYPPYYDAMLGHRIYMYRHQVASTTAWMEKIIPYTPGHLFLGLSTYNNPSDAKIKEMAALAKKHGKVGVVYIHDEPHESEMAKIKTLAKKIKALAPELQIMLTTKWRQDLADAGIDIFTEVLHPGFLTGKARWLYASCMSNGCGPSVGKSSGAPDLVLDREPIWTRVFHWVGYQQKVEAILYYNALENSKGLTEPMSKHPHTGSEWGNLDGILLFPGDDKPIISLRMKYLRRGSQDIELLKHAKKDISDLVRSPFDWEKDESKYDELILSIKKSL